MHYHFKIHKENKGYWAECVEIKGCVTQAENLEDLDSNMSEVLNLVLDEPVESKVKLPLPKKNVSGKNIRKIAVKPNIAFATLLKNERIKKKLTQKNLSELLGMKNIYSYQRLENPKTCNPALKTIVKVKKVLPSINIEKVISI